MLHGIYTWLVDGTAMPISFRLGADEIPPGSNLGAPNGWPALAGLSFLIHTRLFQNAQKRATVLQRRPYYATDIQLPRSTAHIGPWYEMIFFTLEARAMLIIPMEKICKDQRSFETRSSIGGNFSCLFPIQISSSDVLSGRPQLLVLLHVINFLNSQQ